MEMMVTIEKVNNILVTTSNRVAEELGVEHKSLIRKIEQYLTYFSSAQLCAQFYIPSNYKTRDGRMVKNYLITKKGIAQLVGGYSSAVPKAFELNVAYINKFEEMEQELKGSVPRSYAEALLEASRLAFENERLLLEQQENAHRIGFAKTIELSEDGILIREFCKILANEGIMLGEKKLYQYLRENGYIFKHSTEATQRAVEQGLFVVNERAIATVNGSKLTFTTKITGKGQLFFLEKLKKEFK